MRNNWKVNIAPKAAGGKSLDAAWDAALEQGYVGEWSSSKKAGRSFKLEALKAITSPAEPAGMELVLYPTVAFRDGSLGNVSWLHELPDPVTKIVWDNYVNVSYGYAEKESLKEGSMVEVKVGEHSLKLPIHIQPGLHDEVASIAIGYGRTAAGKVGNGIGTAVTQFAKYDGQNLVSAGQPLSLKKLGTNYELANVQGHHTMEGRQIVAEASLKEYEKNGHAGLHSHHVFSLWPGHQYNGHKWGMSIDLNLCNGCSACIVACQSENNIPVVGKKYVLEGREMHWLRVDRYFVGELKNAEVVFQPLVCQQCDNAPCETVCPVIATAHNSEGLNDMTYNRCVGTRYCANNCPYKVRRFNWFYYGDHTQKPLNLALNPDVTVRTRGVMEKCTFCVQRIKSGKQVAKLEKRELKDGEIKTACQQSCPTQAIVFGDLNNPKSAVAQAFSTDPRAYALLAEFNAAPSVRYMTKIRNNGNETRFPGGDAHKGGHA
jgi:molybdopterin-containing oxidoreductase family iron-sulfur binding subunit